MRFKTWNSEVDDISEQTLCVATRYTRELQCRLLIWISEGKKS